MGDWWSDLTTLEQIYWAIALPSTVIFLVLLIMSLFAGADADMDLDADGDIGFQFISVKNLIGFFTMFAWAGLACLEGGTSNTTSIIVAALSGVGTMLVMAGIFYLMSKVTDDGTLQMKNAVDQMGEVYLTIPPKRTGFGKVQIRVQGRLHELEAVTDEEAEITTGKLVMVTDIVSGEILLVKSNG